MPNVQINSITRDGSFTGTIPQWLVDGIITTSSQGDGAVLLDFSGANARQFPQLLTQLGLSASEQLEVVRACLDKVVEIKERTMGQ